MKIEHEPWLPKNDKRIEGQKIAIVGYSHYEDGVDHTGFTNKIVQDLVDRKYKLNFFQAIQGYFGFNDSADFWNRVIFFNFIPEIIGTKEHKYAKGTPEQLERGRSRFLRIVNDHKPEKVFVFTTKGWLAFPEETVEELSGRVCTPLVEGQKVPDWGTYMVGNHRVLVCGFRHPQGAANIKMKEQVNAFLALRP